MEFILYQEVILLFLLSSPIKVKIIAFRLCSGVQKLIQGFVLLLAVGLELAV